MAPPGRVPSVYITNPAARALEESVYADRGKDGLWWFWWSWAERISIADDLDAAASAITRVLCLPRSYRASGDSREGDGAAAPDDRPVRGRLHGQRAERSQRRVGRRDNPQVRP